MLGILRLLNKLTVNTDTHRRATTFMFLPNEGIEVVAVRDLLCGGCNIAIGYLEESAIRAEQAVVYFANGVNDALFRRSPKRRQKQSYAHRIEVCGDFQAASKGSKS